ncbi:MAG: hypothetical protein LAP85_29465 [Acidobacteriia bacterium]|nr:hypothetical protein [Terriglobia bacterium]
MLTQEICEALQAELSFLTAQRVKLEAKIQALKAILSPADELELFQSQRTATMPPKTDSARRNVAEAPMGLRDSIIAALKKYPSGLDIAALTIEIERSGFRASGKTSIKTLVTSESWRLCKRGTLAKKGKKYSLPLSEGGNA